MPPPAIHFDNFKFRRSCDFDSFKTKDVRDQEIQENEEYARCSDCDESGGVPSDGVRGDGGDTGGGIVPEQGDNQHGHGTSVLLGAHVFPALCCILRSPALPGHLHARRGLRQHLLVRPVCCGHGQRCNHRLRLCCVPRQPGRDCQGEAEGELGDLG